MNTFFHFYFLKNLCDYMMATSILFVLSLRKITKAKMLKKALHPLKKSVTLDGIDVEKNFDK
ncbi:MAG TPA: hypothetical protein VN726_13210 [Hanamia sp.]|nr:hypothetical protein [Hanamia sp.]